MQFASVELVEMAANCLDEMTKEMEKDESKDSHATKEESAQGQTQCDQSAEADAATQKSESNDVEMDKQQQDAVASEEKTSPRDSCDPAPGQSKDWVDRVVSAGHSILWPQSMTPSIGPTLLTGVRLGEEDRLVDDLMEWERKLENANLDSHMQFLRNAQLTAANHPMEATAWENGYVPEAQGLPSDQLESRIQGSLPPLAYMASRPRQPIAAGEELLCRFDAGVRPYWLRDWQSGFGGYTKIYEYKVDVWFVLGRIPQMHACASPCCQSFLNTNRGRGLQVRRILQELSSWICKRSVTGRCLQQ